MTSWRFSAALSLAHSGPICYESTCRSLLEMSSVEYNITQGAQETKSWVGGEGVGGGGIAHANRRLHAGNTCMLALSWVSHVPRPSLYSKMHSQLHPSTDLIIQQATFPLAESIRQAAHHGSLSSTNRVCRCLIGRQAMKMTTVMAKVDSGPRPVLHEHGAAAGHHWMINAPEASAAVTVLPQPMPT